MKPLKQLAALMLCVFLLAGLSSCDKHYSVESVVHADGSIDRTVVLSDTDSGKAIHNIFGVNQNNGWDVTVQATNSRSENPDEKNGKYDLLFRKSFASAEEANEEMNRRDTLFNIKSDFEKNFRWFYTYIRYSDTYLSVNRFNKLKQDDYFTQEDYTFIDRLPAEGQAISKADSLYLKRLDEKIADDYFSRAIYEEFYDALSEALKTNNTAKQWLDSLRTHKEPVFQQLLKSNDDFDINFMLEIADSLNIPLSPPIREDYTAVAVDIEKKLNFMSDAYSGKYVHIITMPWDVMNTNADSVSGDRLYWKPPVTKLLLKDYVMYAEARKLNIWPLVISGVIIAVTGFALFRNAKRSTYR